MTVRNGTSRNSRRRSFGIRRQERRQSERHEPQAAEYEMDEFDTVGETGVDSGAGAEGWEGEGEGEMRARRRVARRAEGSRPARPTLDDSHRPSSVWWWGPLQRWRLQDSTDYRS